LLTIIFVFPRVTGIPKSSLFAVMWRPLLAACAMALALVQSAAALRDNLPNASNIMHLVVLVPTGAVSYACAAMVLWLLAGRPLGAEQMLIKQISALLNRMQAS